MKRQKNGKEKAKQKKKAYNNRRKIVNLKKQERFLF